jgi:uncharacterized SAM-binding protein YcdF (DUF218 family)
VRFDALVLLGCRVSAGSLPGAAARRVARAAAAYHDGLSSHIVVSGGRAWDGLVEADALAAELARAGVPRSALTLERASGTTLENARLTAPLLAELGARSVGLVSCDWHLARALWCFRRAGIVAAPVPAPSPSVPALRRGLRGAKERGAWLLDRAVALAW